MIALMLTMVLAIGLLVGGGVLAMADPAPNFGATVITPNELTIQQTAALGSFVPIGVESTANTLDLAEVANVTVTAPNAETALLSRQYRETVSDVRHYDWGFFATMTGVYNVRFSAGDEAFDFSVRVSAEGDYELRIAHGGAAIPSFLAHGDDISLARANLYFRGTRQGDEFIRLTEGVDYDLEIRINGRPIPRVDGNLPEYYENAQAGTRIVEYVARLRAENGQPVGRVFTQQFTVRVQHGFENDSNPSLSVGAVPVHASINTRVTLPAATGTDTFDDRVFIQVRVFDPSNNPVRFPSYVNRHGFNEGGNQARDNNGNLLYTGTDPNRTPVLTDIIEFDNVHHMYFYPSTNGTYRVEFTAINDQGRTSATITRTIEVRDRTAPLLYHIDEHMIPRNWGHNVLVANPDQNALVRHVALSPTDRTIRIPFPHYVDNVLGTRPIVSFTIRDTVNNRNILTINNINHRIWNETYNRYDVGTDARVQFQAQHATNGWVNPGHINWMYFTDDGFDFNFDWYRPNQADASVRAPAGRYVLTFQARDIQPNITTRTYDIVLHETWTDTQVPSIEEFSTERLVFLTDEAVSHQLPNALIVDNDDRLNIVYGVVFQDNNGNPVGTRERVYVGRGVHRIHYDINLVLENGANIELSQNYLWYWPRGYARNYANRVPVSLNGVYQMRVVAMVADSVGNTAIWGNNRSRNSAGVMEDRDHGTTIEFVMAGRVQAAVDLDIDYSGFNYYYQDPVDYPSFPVRQQAELGRLEFNTGTSFDYRNFNGFELVLRQDGSDRPIPFDFTTWTRRTGPADDPNTTATVVVENIAFTPGADGEYTLTARAFDITGRSKVQVFRFHVGANGNGTPPIVGHSSPGLPRTGYIHVTYRLLHERAPFSEFYDDSIEPYIVREFKDAGHFSLMGLELTALSATRTMRITTGYRAALHGDLPHEVRPGHAGWRRLGLTDEFTATETGNLVFALQGAMPTYNYVIVRDRSGDDLRNYETDDFINHRVVLPQIVAHAEHVNALDIRVEINHQSSISPLIVQEGVWENLYRVGDTLHGYRVVDGVRSATSEELERSQAVRHRGNSFSFEPTENGEFTITYIATVGSLPEVRQSFNIRVGAITPPHFNIVGTHQGLRQGNEFRFLPLEIIGDDDEEITITRRLISPAGNHIYDFSTITTDTDFLTRVSADEENPFEINETGNFVVEYTAIDRHGNRSYIRRTITVTGDGPSGGGPLRVLQVVLIIVGSLLIAGVLLYFVRYRKVKEVPKAKVTETEKETE